MPPRHPGFLGLVLLLQAAAVFGQAPASVMFRGDPRHTGIYGTPAVRHFGGVQWRTATGGPIRSTPALAGGTLYFGSGDGSLYAVDATTGTERWRFQTGGAVSSSPAVAGETVYFTSRDHHLYALDAARGTVRWTFDLGADLPYAWAFDYFTSSPTVVAGTVYVGSGDGHLYAVDAASGQARWMYEARGLVRSSGAVADGTVYVGDTAGVLHAVEAATGRLRWVFETVGASLDPADFGFDRQAIISSPALAEGLVVVGGRDGFLYAVDQETGAERWRVDHEVSWVISSPAIRDGVVYAGTSDGQYMQAVALATGEKKWRQPTRGIVWASPVLAGDVVYASSGGGLFYAFDAGTGAPLWQFRAARAFFGSPIVHDGVIYAGNDDGMLYALAGPSDGPPSAPEVKRAVYWTPPGAFFQPNRDVYVRSFFEGEGYEVLGDTALARFMRERLDDGVPSVVVFASSYVPAAVLTDTSEAALLRRYLERGRVVWIGPTPLAFLFDAEGAVRGLDYSVPERVLGIHYGGPDTRGYRGLYTMIPTEEGRRRGLAGWWTGCCSVAPDQVTTVLAKDEVGRAGAWEKTFGGPAGTGLLQLWVDRDLPEGLPAILQVAEFGLVR